MLVQNTPVQLIAVNNRIIHVKREDLCIAGPSFSKLRGVAAHLRARPETTIGVLDTFHSKAGWGVSFLCDPNNPESLKKQVVVYYPVYKEDMIIRGNQLAAKKCGATIVGLTAGRSCILYHRAKKDLEKYHNSYMLPNALKCPESVNETAAEVLTMDSKYFDSKFHWVVSVSSGTIAAGVLKGLVQRQAKVNLILHCGYSRPEKALLDYVIKMAGGFGKVLLSVVDEGYNYKDGINFHCPFPCNIYYDRKAWRWVTKQPEHINFLFWNVGA